MAYRAVCPACGAEVIFKTGSSLVVVCEYCHSVVARTDKGVEDLGRVADVVESGSPLDVGVRGVLRGASFELTGRAQLQHAAGGFWDEWYAAFDDGRWGWLAEAQGRFYLTFQIQVPDPQSIPPFDSIELGQSIAAIPAEVPPVVAEKGEARMLGAEGEIPYLLVPGEVHPYADLSGQGGVFGTLDYGERPPLVFVGRETTLEELGLAGLTRTREREARTVAASKLNCPKCAGPLELRAPDRAERVTCPNCGSLLDIAQGQLRYLKTLEPKGPAMSIPMGATAEFDGHPKTVIGFMVRSVEFDGVRYFWQEYLLYNPQTGFSWLVESDGHWSYVTNVAPGEITQTAANRATYGGKSFRIFQDAPARVEYVAGEFYWKVAVGETVRAVDFISPPRMLSKEVSAGGAAQWMKGAKGKKREEPLAPPGALAAEEVNWSLGTYVPVKEIKRKFNVRLPRPQGVAPNQPFKHKGIYPYWLLLVFLALLFGTVMLVTGSRTTVFDATYTLRGEAAEPSSSPVRVPPTPPPRGASTSEFNRYREQLSEYTRERVRRATAPTSAGRQGTQVIFTDQFELRARQNVRISGSSNVENNWLYVAGDLINEETGLVQQFDLPIEYYHGVDGGESWSEGGRDKNTYISALPAGRYTMRLEAQWENWNQTAPPRLSVKVQQGVPRFINVVLLVIGLSIIPGIVAIRHISFEKRRWADSDYSS